MTSRSLRRIFGAAVVLLLVGGGWAAWRWRDRPSAPSPPMPAAFREDEVRILVERARREVLDEPLSADAWGHLGMVFMAHSFDREATRCFAEAARLDPSDPRWPYALAAIALKGEPDAALPLLHAAAEASEGVPRYRATIRLTLAESLLERGDLDGAERLIAEEYRRNPKNLRAALRLGMVAAARGDASRAERLLMAARASPHAAKAATARLAALARSRGAPSAELDREATERPDDPPWPDPLLDALGELQVGDRGRHRKVTMLEKEQRYAEAAQVYLDDLKRGRTVVACVGAGLELSRLGDYDRALPLLREGVRLGPDNAQAHFTLGLALFDRAEKWRHENPDDGRAKEGMREAAASARRATDLEPGLAAAYLVWGLAAKHADGPAAALGPLQKGVSCQPTHFELQYGLGETLMDLNRPREAETHLENARKLDPKDPRPAQALERLRKGEKGKR